MKAALVLALAALAWLGWSRWPQLPERAGVAKQEVAVPATAPAPASVSAAPPPPVRRAAAPVQPPAELCGGGVVTQLPPGVPEQAVLVPGGLSLAQARQRLLAALAAGDVRSRAAGLTLRPLFSQPAAQFAAWSAEQVEQALGSGDSLAMQWALNVCRHVADAAGCRQRLTQAAVDAEPRNAMNWAQWPAEDPTRADVAWSRVAQAARWDSGDAALPALAWAAMPADVPPYLRLLLVTEVWGLAAAMPFPPLAGLVRRCTPPLAPQRQTECDAIAHLLVERSDTLLTLAIGRRVARGAGWPEDRLAAVETEYTALLDASMQQATLHAAARQPLGCATYADQNRRYAALLQGGELAALRQR